MPPSWPRNAIRELIALAQLVGQAEAELSSETDAKAFRFAIYYFRRKHKVGQELTVSIDKNKVVLKQTELKPVNILV